MLKGTLRFSQMEEEDMKMKENYFESENDNSSPETAEQHSQENKTKPRSQSKRSGMFYMSSEDNSENAESPNEGPIPVVTPRKGSIRKEAHVPREDDREYELSDRAPLGSRKPEVGGALSQAVDATEKSHPLESSPNPLYDYNCSVDSV